MAQPSVQGNGCSLEDCYTNLFTLTDLTGIHYRKYSYRSERSSSLSVEDSILTTFSRCRHAGLLCAWTRKPRDNTRPNEPYNINNFSKELWLFWYDETEPSKIHDMISPDLKEVDSGSWENGLTYQCRTVLFKALHNVIESYLMHQGYLRIGKWFCQPMKKSSNQSANERNYSVSFSFFLHGESTVCASLDVRHMKPVRKITARHLKLCTDNNIKLRVILSPYGISGHLTGRRCRDDDAMNATILRQWTSFYPLNFDEDSRGGSNDLGGSADLAGRSEPTLPKLVEVMVGGRRMRYPSCFVLVVDDDVAPHLREKLEDAPHPMPVSSSAGVSPAAAAAAAAAVHGGPLQFGASHHIPSAGPASHLPAGHATHGAVLMSPHVSALLPYYGQRALTRAHQDAFVPLKRKSGSGSHGASNSTLGATSNSVGGGGGGGASSDQLTSSTGASAHSGNGGGGSSGSCGGAIRGTWQYCDRSSCVDCECRRVFDSARQLPLMQRQGAARSTRFYNRFRTRPLPAPVPSTVPPAAAVPANTTPVRLASTADAAWDERFPSKYRSVYRVNKSFDRTLRAPQRPATGSGEPIMPTLSPQTPMLEKESGPESVNANAASSVGTTNEKGSCGACPDSNVPSVSAGNEMMDTESTGGIKTPASAPGPIGIAIDSSPYPPTQTGTNACPTGSSDDAKGTNVNHSESEWPPAREGMTNCSMTNGAVLDFDSSTPLSNAETKPTPVLGPTHVSSAVPAATATATVSMSAGGAPLQHHSWDYWSERMHRSWASTTNGAAFSAAAPNCGSSGGGGGGGGNGGGGNGGGGNGSSGGGGAQNGGKESNHGGLTEAVSPGRPALLPGVEDFDDPLQTCRDAGHVRVAGLRRPRIAGSWMEEPESKYFRMGYPLPSPLLTNKRPATEPAGNSSSNYNWKSEAALRPTEKVPDQIFDCEEDDGDGNVPLLQKQPPDPLPGALHPQLHPQSQEQMAHQPIGHSIASSNGSGPIAASELARMYPTPPSTEVNHALASPVEAAVGVGALLPHVEVAPKASALGGQLALGGGASNPAGSLAVAHKGKAVPGRVKGAEPNGLVLQPEVDWKFGRPVQGVFVFGVPYSASLGLDTLENSKEELEKGAVTLSYHHRKAGVHPLLQKMDRFSAAQNNSSVANAAGGSLTAGAASLNVSGGLTDVPQSPASLPTLPGLGPGHGGGGTPLMGGRYFPGSAPPGSHRVAPLTPGSSYQGTHPGADCASLTSAGASPANAAAATAMRTPRTPGTGGLADYSSPASSGASSSFVGSRAGGLGSVGGGQHSVERPASHPPPPPPTPAVSEVHSLLVNLVLSDSLLNLFKDHNFDSCNICECNSNTKGADVGLYLLDSPLCQSENKRPCTCGFSAVVNKRYAPHSGLFYEDEAELVGIREERPYRTQPPLLRLNENGSMHHLEKPPPEVQNLLYDQVMSSMDIFTTGYMLDWYRHERTRQSFTIRENLHEYRDACEVVRQALDASIIDRHGGANGAAKMDEDSRHLEPLHSWPYLKESQRLPQEEGEALSLLKSIRPWLHQALCDTRILEFTYVVSGPLTWKEFHKLAGRGNEESCEPQPLPHIVVGSDNGASSGDGGVAIAPYAVQNWEQLALKPFSRQKDVWYLALVPDNTAIFSEVCHFFRELSCVYELCRLGRHVPLPDVVPVEDQGIIRVSERLCSIIDHDSMNPPSPELDQWFAQLSPSHIPSHAEVISKIALYARVCRHFVVNSLKKHGPELVRKAQNAAVAAAATSGIAASSLKGQGASGSPHATSPAAASSNCGGGGGTGSNYSMPPLRSLKPGVKAEPGCLDPDSNVGASAAANAFHLVIYLVNPFVYSHDYGDVYRLAMLALMRMVKEIKTQFPPELHNCTTFQMVPLSQITGLSRSTGYDAANNQGAALISVDSWNRPKPNHALTLKAMAFDTYTQLRRVPTVQQFNGNRTLTGFGPTAEREELLRRQPEFSRSQRLVFSPLFTLLPTRDYRSLRDHKSSDQLDKSSVLFCAYCLSEDQHWLLAVCTDAVGELMEHACINIRIPDRHRRKRASARRVGLSKLWDFIIGIISETCCPWRLVVQRMGRIGHRELTAWNGLLGKKNLARTTALLRENCRLCTKLHAGGGGSGGNGGGCGSTQHDLPSLVSACLVSMEPQSTFRVWPHLVCTTEERMSSNLPLVTPRDTSVTHILVFPTSAMAQCQSNASGMGMGMGIMGSMDGDMFEGLDIEGIPDGIDGMDFDFSDQEIMSYELAAANGPNSPTGMTHIIGGVGGPADMHNKEGNGSAEGPGGPVDPQDDMTNTLMQQPLAMGFYLSTAPAGPLPSWFWSTCPQACVLCPAIFKAALHVNTFSVTDDVGVQTGKERVAHPLDSSLTTDVLRFVLESYNSLSWLTIDPVTNDRRSCLPVHILYLTHLSNAQFAFI